MYRFRLLIIATIAWLFLALNIERPDELLFLGHINISSFVYVIGAFIMISHLVLVQMNRMSWQVILALFGAMYIIGKILTFNSGMDAATYTYIMVLEIVGLGITVVISRKLAQSIFSFGDAIRESVLNPTNTLIQHTHHGELAIRQKIAQARRFDRRLALLYVKINHSWSKSEYTRIFNQREEIKYMYLQLRIAELVTFLLWETDGRAWNQGNLILCLQGPTQERASMIAEQVAQVLKNVMDIDASVSVAYFPDDGLVYDDLLETLKSNERLPVPRQTVFNLVTRPAKHRAQRAHQDEDVEPQPHLLDVH
ncbi:MAG: hypothetical protein L0154_26905 [Chloroflexi bacterium]|nr:hypothetical protein [Chloroflexota bacterium]